MSLLQKLIINYQLPEGPRQDLELSFEVFGAPLHSAPVLIINHALTGNSSVAGENGWWQKMISEVIDLKKFTIIGFNIPGNGYLNTATITDYQKLTTKIVADLFWIALDQLKIKEIFAVIGGSLGGAIAWEMALLRPNAIQHLIPIACNIKSSDWLVANVFVQEQILINSSNPIQDARKHAMLLYRAPESFDLKFQNIKTETGFAVESWLHHHGEKLNQRFSLEAYLLMNHLLRTIGADLNDENLIAFAKTSSSEIHCIAIDSDYLFTNKEQQKTVERIAAHHTKIFYHEIESVHGHDAFLIEYQQLNSFLKPIFS